MKFFLVVVEGYCKFEKFNEMRKLDMYYLHTIFEFEEIVWRKFLTSFNVFDITNS